METVIKGEVGQKLTADSVEKNVRLSRYQELIIAPGLGDYAEGVRNGELFFGANVAAQAISVALATTYTGLVLSNPINSPNILYVLQASFALSVAPAGIAPLAFLTGKNTSTEVTHTTPIAPLPALIGSALEAIGNIDSAATLPTAPVYTIPFLGGFTAGALFGTSPAVVDLKGSIALLPGSYFAIGALTAVTGLGGILWQEKKMNAAANP